jgi:hypothetical protein
MGNCGSDPSHTAADEFWDKTKGHGLGREEDFRKAVKLVDDFYSITHPNECVKQIRVAQYKSKVKGAKIKEGKQYILKLQFTDNRINVYQVIFDDQDNEIQIGILE